MDGVGQPSLVESDGRAGPRRTGKTTTDRRPGGKVRERPSREETSTNLNLLSCDERTTNGKRTRLRVPELLLVAVLLALHEELRLDLVRLRVRDRELGRLLPLGVEPDPDLGRVARVAVRDGDPAPTPFDVEELDVELLDVARGDVDAAEGGG
eukprot:11957-Pelagococcus_subviridis.AAC.1